MPDVPIDSLPDDDPPTGRPPDDQVTDDQVTDDQVTDDQVTDELPAELDLAQAGPITFPNNDRRRIPAAIYGVLGLGCIWLGIANDDSVFVNRGVTIAGVVLVALAVYVFVAGRGMNIDEGEALVAANQAMGFAVGHASAQLSWRGVLSRPVWRLLVYSSEEPPERRGMVIVDAVDGSIAEQFSEVNPEDWNLPNR